jgi:hypothetical protein
VPERARLIADKSLEGGDMGNSADIPDDMVRSIDKLGDVPGVYDRD